jgi:hypothetical protein
VTRYQQGTYGLSQDLRFCRQQSMELSRELAAVKKELEETKFALATLQAICEGLDHADDRS